MIYKYSLLTGLLLAGCIWLGTGCQKQPETISLTEKSEEDDGTDTKRLTENASEESDTGMQPENMPVIQVQCSCTCGCSSRPDAEDTAASAQLPQEQSGERKININTADIEQLQELKGIGQTRAQAIIEYRETYGRFENVEEIMNVAGIKEGTYSQIQNDISIE